jgi:hypothetical protein
VTIDERLEALTQTVELMAHMQIETEKKFGAAITAVSEAQAKTERTVNRLGRYAMLIARDHEARLAALESDELDSDE